jgi:hypothetical protein
MEKEWLQKKISKAEAEAEHMVSSPRFGPSPVAFGFQNGRWRALISKMQDADERWTLSSSGDSWEHLCGRAGIALVRRGEIVDLIVNLMN